MKTQVKLLDTVIKKLNNIQEPCYGQLYGIIVVNSVYIVGVKLNNEETAKVSFSFPAEVDLCGVFEAYSEYTNLDDVLSNCGSIDVTDTPIYLSVQLNSQQELSCNTICNNKTTETKYEVITVNAFYSEFLHIRLRGKLLLNSEANEKSITENFLELRKHIVSGVSAFKLPKLNIVLSAKDTENGIIGVSGDPTFSEVSGLSESTEGKSKKKNLERELAIEIVDTELLKKVTRDGYNTDKTYHSPVVVLDRKQLEIIKIPINIDFLSLVHKNIKLSALYNVILESAIRNMRLYESSLLNYLKVNPIKAKIKLPDILHFFPEECAHFITRIVFDQSEDVLKKERETLHDALLLSKLFPMFRKGNKYQFPADDSKNNGPLINPHKMVKLTNNGGKVCLVKGNYEYYHYCQNKMDDNGWGCAYRSLQTLASWFKLQGYTDTPVPTFKDIQSCLVQIGDKPNSFIDSRQWIGSTEVNYVLDTLLGVTSKILYVSSGEELAFKGPELVNHFEVHGSPVMIGGGVLAHTILGVDYNQDTGNLKFLILDPHYTGEDEINTIVNKGWCGWKGTDFWDKTSYYNMCMPQVPRGV